MSGRSDVERAAIEHDHDLAWELFEAQPQHPRIAELALGVLAREPSFTGQMVLLALHRQACGQADEARRLLQDLIGRRDRHYVNALRKLRDLELAEFRHDEALRLADLVLREDPEHGWEDRMDRAAAVVYVVGAETGWDEMDRAVELCARHDPDHLSVALGQRALRFLASSAPPARFASAAQAAIEADPTESRIAIALGFARLYEYRAPEADELFRRVLREDPTDPLAQDGMAMTRAFIDPVERGEMTVDVLRQVGLGELAWRLMRDATHEVGLDEALVALDAVLPTDLEAALRPPLEREAARASGGESRLLAWRDGQLPGTGARWGTGTAFRLMTGDEVAAMDEAIEREPDAWPRWDSDEFYTQLATDDAGSYLIEGFGGRLYRRGPDGPDEEVAPSLADWVWDRVAAFGGQDRRPLRPQ